MGKAAIFQKQRAWEHPLGQSDRGLANLLSTLRSFTNITSGGKMEEDQQDAVLRVIHLMTRFPPAVRAAYVLMLGECPSPSECAALSQCVYEILKDTIPLTTIRNDPRRFYEGSRLLFGLIIGKAKKLRVSPSNSNNNPKLTYTTMQVYDLRNTITMLPVRGSAIESTQGLIDGGMYDAFAEDGVLTWINGIDTTKVPSVDSKLARIAILAGGGKVEVVNFDPDVVAFAARYPDKYIASVVTQAEASNLQYLATLCSNNQLSVILPADLPSASPPVLTMDRNGFLAVYVGREACRSAGRDMLMFRPMSGEETVDVSIITQSLVPILARRHADGTAVFEAYGNHHRQVKDPDEVIVVCVDLSESMDSWCGFIDVKENEDANAPVVRNTSQAAVPTPTSSIAEYPGSERLTLEELKGISIWLKRTKTMLTETEYLLGHSSFDDMLAIVRAGIGDHQRAQNASKVLKILGQLDRQRIAAVSEKLEWYRQSATSIYYRMGAIASERDLTTLSNRFARMERSTDSLCAFLVYRAENAGSLPDPLVWRPGAAAPTARVESTSIYRVPRFEVPAELLCPISSDLMDDPVMTVDNFTYERRNIVRW